ncbi:MULTISPECIES: hypothetical protein [unclassified Eikenella]|uniref:hypothetical protein n=1 Tax=unclassified Eikenella TaxID=2639367 RepID=UPI0007E14951|nr:MULTISPECIES: hypothetical protein [unclassified Eikenella]OAM33519.1 hypothetical protein A7P97_08030 [Eikenella sp. NML070372]
MATLPTSLSTSGIYRTAHPAAVAFPFHQNGIIDRPLRQAQHQAARVEMLCRVRALLADTAWISLSENGFGFWARISRLAGRFGSLV